MSKLIKITTELCKSCKYCQKFYTDYEICCMYAALADDLRVLNSEGKLKYDPAYCDKFEAGKHDSRKWIADLFTPKAITKDHYEKYFKEL